MRQGFRVLLADVHWLDETGEPRGPGFIAIRDGRVSLVDVGEPPEEEQYAEMVAGGAGRLVVPAFSMGLVSPESYVLRGFPGVAPDALVSGGWWLEAVASMSGEEAYHASLMMFYEAALNGYTTVVAYTPHPRPVAEALRGAGLRGLVLAPGPGCPVKAGGAVEGGAAGVRVAELRCAETPAAKGYTLTGDGILHVDGAPVYGLPPWRSGVSPAPGVAMAANPWCLLSGPRSLDAYRALVLTGHRLVEPGYQPLEGAANLVVVNAGEPPGWIPSLGYAGPSALGPTRPRVETVFSWGRIIVDGGDHMYLGPSSVEEAARKLQGFLGRVAEKLRG